MRSTIAAQVARSSRCWATISGLWQMMHAPRTSGMCSPSGSGLAGWAVGCPDAKPTTLEMFRRHAYAFVTKTSVSWRYDEATAELVTLLPDRIRTGEYNLDRVLQ